MARTYREVKEKLADIAPSIRGQHPEERRLLLERRAESARERGDHASARYHGRQATEAMLAAEAGEPRTGWNAEVPHYAGEITVRKVEDEQQVPVRVEQHDQHAAA